jgi:hypothetical protein
MKRKYLLVVRAGDASLHPMWLSPEPRLWDLHISYFGDREAPFGALPEGVTLSREKGPKYLGLSECLAAHPQFMERYTYLGFPDDDLACDGTTWNNAFAILEEIGADLGQPSLDSRSFFSYDIVLRREQFKYREVDFVELMCPIFSAPFLSELLPTWTLNKSSWGLDYVWRETARGEGRHIVIVDASSVLHTRAIGKGGQYSAANMRGGSRYDDFDAVRRDFNINDLTRNVLRGVRPDGSVVMDARQLNRRLVLAGLRRKWRNLTGVAQIAADAGSRL